MLSCYFKFSQALSIVVVTLWVSRHLRRYEDSYLETSCKRLEVLHGCMYYMNGDVYFYSKAVVLNQSCLLLSTSTMQITLTWNSLPKNIKDPDTISSFKSKLKSFYFTRLLNVFDGDNFRSFKLICPKCRRVNIFSVCTC